jgi:hypothetical protein
MKHTCKVKKETEHEKNEKFMRLLKLEEENKQLKYDKLKIEKLYQQANEKLRVVKKNK